MSFRDLKPEYRQKLQHILDEFARVAKENEKLRQDVALLKQYKQQQTSKIAELRRENAQLLKIAGERTSKDSTYSSARRAPPTEQKQPQIFYNASPNLLHSSPQPVNASTEDLKRIYERLGELLPAQASFQANSEANRQPRYEHTNQRETHERGLETDYLAADQQQSFHTGLYQARHEQTLAQAAEARFLTNIQYNNNFPNQKYATLTLRPSGATEQISEQIRQTLPDLGYLQAKLGNCTQISLSDDMPGAPAPATRSVALQYSEVARRPADVLSRDTPGTDFYCALQPPSQSGRENEHESAEVFQKTPFPLQAQTFESEPPFLETDFRRSRRPSQESAAGKNGDLAENNITLSSVEPAAFPDYPGQGEGLALVGDKLPAEGAERPPADQFARLQRRPQQENKIPLTQVREAVPAEMSSGRRSEILEQSRILMLNARKDFIKRKPQQAGPQDQLRVSAARLAQSSRVQEEQQRQKIMKSLTSMQEDELDDLLNLLNSGVRY